MLRPGYGVRNPGNPYKGVRNSRTFSLSIPAALAEFPAGSVTERGQENFKVCLIYPEDELFFSLRNP
jgi:hypothetical protein